METFVRAKRQGFSSVLLSVALLVGKGQAAGTAEAIRREENKFDLAKIAKAKVGVSQAIDAAIVAVGGNVINAGFVSENGESNWEIELAENDGTVKTVLVNAESGAVDINPPNEGERRKSSGGRNLDSASLLRDEIVN